MSGSLSGPAVASPPWKMLNRQALLWRDQMAHQRPWPGDDSRTVAQAFAEEQPLCFPYRNILSRPIWFPCHAESKTIYIRFDLNDYSIPPHAVGRPLTLVASRPRSTSWMGKELLAIAAPSTAASGSWIPLTRKLCSKKSTRPLVRARAGDCRKRSGKRGLARSRLRPRRISRQTDRPAAETAGYLRGRRAAQGHWRSAGTQHATCFFGGLPPAQAAAFQERSLPPR